MTPEPESTAIATLTASADAYARAALADETVRAYASDWRAFTAWCRARGLDPLPATPDAVRLHVADLATTHKAASIRRRLASVAKAHRVAGLADPTKAEVVANTWKGVRRAIGTAQRGADPVLVEHLRLMVAGGGDRAIDHRDRAILLLAFASAQRRSTVAALDVADLRETPEGLVLTVRRSKTDQEGEGAVVGVPYGSNPATCPVRAVRAWLVASGIADGALFRHVDRHGHLHGRISGQAVASVVARLAARAGLPPGRYSGHSTRAGFATQAAMAGVAEREIATQTQHRSMAVLRRYIRAGSVWQQNPATRVGL